MTFENLGLLPALLQFVQASGYTEPTPIQSEAIPHVLAGRDLSGQAQTGTGKTAAFALPILQRLHAQPSTGRIRALVLAPTRELAAQIQETFQGAGAGLRMRSAVIFGGVNQNPQARAIRQGLDVLVATPGRLLDLSNQGLLRLDAVEILVLDEADRMMDMGFIPDLRRILKLIPAKRQTLLFSATFPPTIEKLARELLQNPVKVLIPSATPTADKVEQYVQFVDKARKRSVLANLLADPDVERAVVFTRTKHGANRVAEGLSDVRISAEAIHGNKSQNARERALANFKDGTTRVLVATDLAARGIDVIGISHVINFDMPSEAETYVHRIGRTARAGASGVAISLVDREERSMLRDIEKLIGRRIDVEGADAAAK